MWDGRESFAPMGTAPIRSDATPDENVAALFNDLKHHAKDATLTHAEADTPLTDEVAEAIARFESNLATAQQRLHHVVSLDAKGAQGGRPSSLRNPSTSRSTTSSGRIRAGPLSIPTR
jgi:hypothetical protein